MLYAQTLTRPVTVEGIGLHTGAEVRVTLRPAPAGRGRVFLRGEIEIPAVADYVVSTRRCTTLGRDGAEVHTVEHLLAACLLAGVSDIDIAVDGPELPALGGSAEQWLNHIRLAGICRQDIELPILSIPASAWVEEGNSAFFLLPAETLSVYAAISIPETAVDHMVAGGVVADADVCAQLARARTYGLEREVRALQEAGLARGGSLDNALVLTRDGYLNAQVWPNEPAWHKALDLLGDLALVGLPLAGQVVAVRAGHAAHVALARRLRAEARASGLLAN